jgi:hypothetical protein
MKTIVTAIAAGLAVLVVAAPSPIAAPEASPTLRQFNALKNRVANLERDVNCMDDVAYPVSQYGSESGSQGYHYTDSQGSEFLTSALDETVSGEVPDVWLAEVNANCISDGPTARFHAATASTAAAKAVNRSRRG